MAQETDGGLTPTKSLQKPKKVTVKLYPIPDPTSEDFNKDFVNELIMKNSVTLSTYLSGRILTQSDEQAMISIIGRSLTENLIQPLTERIDKVEAKYRNLKAKYDKLDAFTEKVHEIANNHYHIEEK